MYACTDILWDQLTGREHLRLFAQLKGASLETANADVEQRIADVLLQHAADRPVKTYSGGMKRRLSIAVSLIGDPSIVFLDEPTTGMDPVTRKEVWRMVERAKMKANRAIVLTTHSMEEADGRRVW